MPSRLGRALRRAALIVASLLVVLLIVGAGWEQWSRRRIPALLPPTSRLVDIGGRRIHLDCRGTGTPVVVFEAGAGPQGALDFAPMQDSLAGDTRVCAYSRAGHLWSDPTTEPITRDLRTRDLKATLTAAGETGPFVFVGHSLGGPLVLHYAAAHPDDVAGVVLIDPSHPDQMARMAAVIPSAAEPFDGGPMVKTLIALAWTGGPRIAARQLLAGERVDPRIAELLPTTLPFVRDEGLRLGELIELAPAARSLSDRPLLVLAAGQGMPKSAQAQLGATDDQLRLIDADRRRMLEEMATWSTRGRIRFVDGAGHFIHADKPGVVVAAIRETLAEVRGVAHTASRSE